MHLLLQQFQDLPPNTIQAPTSKNSQEVLFHSL